MATRTSVRPTYNQTFLDALLTCVKTVPGAALAAAPSLRLFTGGLDPTPTTPLASYTAAIADFTGYASISPAPAAPLVSPTPASRGLYYAGLFVVGTADPLIQNTITGYYLVQGTDWILAERFTEAVEMGITGDFIDLAVFIAGLLQPVL